MKNAYNSRRAFNFEYYHKLHGSQPQNTHDINKILSEVFIKSDSIILIGSFKSLFSQVGLLNFVTN